MNEIEHFFDMEIKRAEDCINHSEDVACFNGVAVGVALAKELNQNHILFCLNAEKSLKSAMDNRDNQISAMQAHIDCLKAELSKVQMNNPELPAEPIKVADILIEEFSKGSVDYIHSAIENGYSYNDRTFDEMHKQEIKLLRQIAEHLLVYCNNAEVEE